MRRIVQGLVRADYIVAAGFAMMLCVWFGGIATAVAGTHGALVLGYVVGVLALLVGALVAYLEERRARRANAEMWDLILRAMAAEEAQPSAGIAALFAREARRGGPRESWRN